MAWTIAELTQHFKPRNTVEVTSRNDVEVLVTGLVEKDLVVREDDAVQLTEFDTGP